MAKIYDDAPIVTAPPLSARILYQSAVCIIVNKLQGEAVQAVKQNAQGSLRAVDLGKELAGVLTGLPAKGRLLTPQAAHRLDVPVTGCAVFALTKNALSFLSAAFAQVSVNQGSANQGSANQGSVNQNPAKKIEKRYWAVAEKPKGRMQISEKGEMAHWLRFDSAKNKSFAYDCAGPGRKKAVLSYALSGEGKNYLFFEVELVTGRHHQIRAQFAASGLFIKGDLKYGAKRGEKAGGLRLHAYSLSIPDPLSGEKISVSAHPPVMDNLWEAFLHKIPNLRG